MYKLPFHRFNIVNTGNFTEKSLKVMEFYHIYTLGNLILRLNFFYFYDNAKKMEGNYLFPQIFSKNLSLPDPLR